MRQVNFILTLIAPCAQTWIAAILFRKKLHRRFSLFLAYTLYSIAAAVVRLFFVRGSPRTYYYLFWATEPLYALLGVLAIYQAFKEIYRPLYALWWFRLLLYAVILVPLAAVGMRFMEKPPIEANQLGAAILSLETGVRYVQACIFGLSATLIYLFQIPARRYPAGIVDGFGAAAVGILFGTMFRSEYGTRFNTVLSFAPAVAYIIALLIWITSLRGPEKRDDETGQLPMSPEEMRDHLRRYLRGAKKISRPKRE